jgi:hypothetical protein
VLYENRVSFLAYLKASAFSEWLSISMLGFPTLIALHSVGMAIVVGLSLMVTLSLYGALPGIGDAVLPRLLNVAVWGFVLNFLTGLALFITRGPEYITSLVFLVKMLLVIVGAVILFWLREQLARRALTTGRGTSDGIVRAMSLAASLVWFGAVVAGRLIAYLSSLYR